MESDFIFDVTQESLRGLENSLLMMAATFHKSVGEVVRGQGRLIAVNLAFNTQPYGFDATARNRGEWAALRDVRKVYRSISVVTEMIEAQSESAAKGFFKAVKAGDLAKAREILHAFGLTDLESLDIGAFDPAIHRQLRNKRGRVGRVKPRLIVTDPAKLRAYEKQVQTRVGTAKSSWASCARQIGGVRGIPYWATKNNARGIARDLTGDSDNPRVILHSDVDYMDIVLPPAMRADALDKQRNKMNTAVRMAAERAARISRLAA